MLLRSGIDTSPVQNALVHEHIVSVLSQPHSVRKVLRITVRGRTLELTGYSPSHWAALCYACSLASQNSAMAHGLAGADAATMQSVQEKCAPRMPDASCKVARHPCAHASLTCAAVHR